MPMLAFAIGFENFASGIGGVVVVAYLSALCNLRYTATQFALLSAAAAIVGRFLTGTTAGALIESMGYVNFYLLTTVFAPKKGERRKPFGGRSSGGEEL